MIQIRGHTGFKPRPLKNANAVKLLGFTSPEKKSYSRSLQPVILDSLTGHKHFQYLNDAVFRTYADLKRDPATSDDTKLIFHIPKEDEHWLVVPQRFTLERTVGKKFLYTYAIDLLIVDKAEALDADFSEDKSLLDTMRDAVRSVKAAVDLASGALQDLTRIAGEIEAFIKDTAKIIDAVGTVLDAARDFVDGVTDLIEAPLALLDSTLGVIDSAMDAWDALKEAKEDITQIDDEILHKFDQIRDAFEQLGTHPDKFTTPARIEAINRQKRTALLRDISEERRQEAENTPAPASLNGWASLGTSLTAGDVESADGELFDAVDPPTYSSAQVVTVAQGDSLPNLAARYLGDARQWQAIADSNNLQAPFLDPQASSDRQTTDERALPGAQGVGDQILVPNRAKGAAQRPLAATLGVRPTEPAVVHLLGRDIRVERVTTSGADVPSNLAPRRLLFDLPIDIAGGSNDAKAVQGVDNLVQGLILRLATERGSDALYTRFGLARTAGLNQVEVDLEATRFRIQEALNGDPRIASVRNVIFEGIDGGTDSPSGVPLDALVVDAQLEVLGFAERQNVRLAV